MLSLHYLAINYDVCLLANLRLAIYTIYYVSSLAVKEVRLSLSLQFGGVSKRAGVLCYY